VRAIRGPLVLITIGIIFALRQYGILPLRDTWPLLLILLGVLKLIERLVLPAPAWPPPPPPPPVGGIRP
jgi:hypothetical protein